MVKYFIEHHKGFVESYGKDLGISKEVIDKSKEILDLNKKMVENGSPQYRAASGLLAGSIIIEEEIKLSELIDISGAHPVVIKRNCDKMLKNYNGNIL